MKIANRNSIIRRGALLSLLTFASCDDFVKVGPPRTELVRSTVFESDATANAAVVDIYFQLARATGFASGDQYSVSYYGALSSDELINYALGTQNETVEVQQINENALTATNSRMLPLWSDPYLAIFKANAVIEGIGQSESLTGPTGSQLEGEARFLRAFCYFNLVNFFGDVPLVLTTDYRINSTIGRTPVIEVYDQIISDLTQAQGMMAETYSFSNNERVRANRYVAMALLARTYLYVGDWANAEIQASAVIQNTTLYRLVTNLPDVFRATSVEALLQLWRNGVPGDRIAFIPPATGPTYGALRTEFVNSFQPGDQRAIRWIGRVTAGGVTYSFPSKYVSVSTPPQDYSTVFRLAELYLVRSEARARQNNVSGAQADLNVIRARAGLPATAASDMTSLLTAIENERKAELFTEWGHRWFDIKRTNRASEVLQVIKPNYTANSNLFPIPQAQLLNDPAMQNAQNPGY